VGWAGLTADASSSSSTDFAIGDQDPSLPERAPANLFVNILSSTGLIGLTLFAAYYYSLMQILARRSRPAFMLGGAFLALSLFGTTVSAASSVTLLFFLLVAAPAARGAPAEDKQPIP
jgi:hypothetical protein